MGVGGDLRSATSLMSGMIGVWGMGDNIASMHGMPQHALDQPPDPTDKITMTMSAQIERRLQVLYNEAYDLLEEHKTAVFNVAIRLQEKQTISGDEVAKIIGIEAGLVTKEKLAGFAAVSAEDHRIALGLPPIEENGQPDAASEDGQPAPDGQLDGEPAPEAGTEDDQPSSEDEDSQAVPVQDNGQPPAEQEPSPPELEGTAPNKPRSD